MRLAPFTAACVTGACLFISPGAGAEAPLSLPVVSTPSATQSTLTRQQLKQLLAPVALYPDQVLADILAAATTPAQIVEAERFVSEPSRAGMTGPALIEAAAGEDWDESVKALLMFPQVLRMMDGKLAWTEHLGRAVIAQQADVMNAVQQLRLAAEQAGTLVTGPYEIVVNEAGDIAIEPPTQQDIYLPAYQPQCVYGADFECDGLDTQLSWPPGIFLPYGYVPWAHLDWGRRQIRLNHSSARGGGANVWRGAGIGGITGSLSQFNYATPANVPFARQGGFASRANFAGSPVRFGASFGTRPLPQHTPVFRAPPHAVAPVHAASGGAHR